MWATLCSFLLSQVASSLRLNTSNCQVFSVIFQGFFLVHSGSVLKPVGEILDTRTQHIYFRQTLNYPLSPGKNSSSLIKPEESLSFHSSEFFQDCVLFFLKFNIY